MKLVDRILLVLACVSASTLILAHNVYAAAGWASWGLDLLWFIRR